MSSTALRHSGDCWVCCPILIWTSRRPASLPRARAQKLRDTHKHSPPPPRFLGPLYASVSSAVTNLTSLDIIVVEISKRLMITGGKSNLSQGLNNIIFHTSRKEVANLQQKIVTCINKMKVFFFSKEL